jgi:ABC-2 type transport system ATP-binding protein
MDEPSTGLDPAARLDLWKHLTHLRTHEGMTIALTTHLMEEAEGCDRLAIMDHGQLVAVGTPRQLKSSLGGDIISILTQDPLQLCQKIKKHFRVQAAVWEGQVRIEKREGHRFIAKLAETFPGEIRSITVSKPTLGDVFIAKTGKSLAQDQSEAR